jgi:dTDP-4-amino-4,6-dideoxygalactose transaminase
VVPEGAIAPWPPITDADRDAVLRALDASTPWHWPMRAVQDLEAAWAEFTGMRHALAANSGTAALHMCVAACGVEPGDEVLVPADTFLASASCVLQANAIPVFVDVDPVTYNLDPDRIEERVTERTRAIVAVDLNGLPADYDRLRAVARRHDLYVIEDGAQAHGATYKGRPVGALGDLASCSLNGSKCLSALAEGGLFTTDDDRWRDNAARVLMFGEELKGQSREYNARIMGWNYRLDPLEAAFARSQLQRLPEMSRVRSANGAHLSRALADVPGVRTPVVPEGLAIDEWQLQPVPGQTLFQELRGYGRGCPWSCGHARPGVGYRPQEYPVALDICERRLVMGASFSSFGPPNGTGLMDLYAEAFHKVLVDHRAALVELARRDGGERGA